MNTDALASAVCQLAKVARQEPEVNKALQALVKKWLKPALGLEPLSQVAQMSGAHVLRCLIEALSEAESRKLAMGLDKYNRSIDRKPGPEVCEHIVSLAMGRTAVALPPPRLPPAGRRNTNPGAVDPSTIRAMRSRSEREGALQSLPMPTLKAYISTEGLRPAGVPPKAKKSDLIRHILDELDAASSTLPRLLAESKYPVGVGSN